MSDRAARLAEKREKLRLMREQKKQRKYVFVPCLSALRCLACSLRQVVSHTSVW